MHLTFSLFKFQVYSLLLCVFLFRNSQLIKINDFFLTSLKNVYIHIYMYICVCIYSFPSFGNRISFKFQKRNHVKSIIGNAKVT